MKSIKSFEREIRFCYRWFSESWKLVGEIANRFRSCFSAVEPVFSHSFKKRENAISRKTWSFAWNRVFCESCFLREIAIFLFSRVKTVLSTASTISINKSRFRGSSNKKFPSNFKNLAFTRKKQVFTGEKTGISFLNAFPTGEKFGNHLVFLDVLVTE